VAIPASVKSVEDYAFSGCVNLTSPAYINAADADVCFDFRTEKPELLTVKRYHILSMPTGKKRIMCESANRLTDTYSAIGFVDESGDTIALFGADSRYLYEGCHDCYDDGISGISVPDTLPSKISGDVPSYMAVRWRQELERMPLKEKQDGIYKNLLRFKGKVINGRISVLPNCKPHELKYERAFRVRVTGECASSFLDGGHNK